MSPSSPASAISLSLATPGWYSSRWPTISVRPVSAAAATARSASATVWASGFSTKQCLPAREHLLGERGVASAPAWPARPRRAPSSASRSSSVRRAARSRERGADALERGGVAVAQPGELAAGDRREVARQVRAPVAESGDADRDRGHAPILRASAAADPLSRAAVAVERRALGRRTARQRLRAPRPRRGRRARSSRPPPSPSTRSWRASSGTARRRGRPPSARRPSRSAPPARGAAAR